MKSRYILLLLIVLCGLACNQPKDKEDRPNVILLMADDLGYGDLACYGNREVLTPYLDQMAGEGIRMTRFYAAAPVCSPTRGSCLTGRHPYRYNIPWAGDGFLPAEEITIAEVLKENGYATGHFGKWHVGTLSRTVKQSYFPGEVDPKHYSPPWENGFDESFSTESMMPTYNPYYMVGGDYGTEEYRFIQDVPVEKGQETGGFKWRDFYWTGEGQTVNKLEGEDSELIMDRALDFIGRQCETNQPFLSVIWFHTPHTPVVAGPDHRNMYSDKTMREQHWFGSITAMDEQIGRLRTYLKEKDIADNTIVWFCSDNGPSYIHELNSNGGLRGKKATLYEGGIRVPAILEWPAKIKQCGANDRISSTSDFYPSILWACGVKMPAAQPVVDGVNVLERIVRGFEEDENYICFQSPLPARLRQYEAAEGEQLAVVSSRFKLLSINSGESYQLFDLVNDTKEEQDISHLYPNVMKDMQKHLNEWRMSCTKSSAGEDYQKN